MRKVNYDWMKSLKRIGRIPRIDDAFSFLDRIDNFTFLVKELNCLDKLPGFKTTVISVFIFMNIIERDLNTEELENLDVETDVHHYMGMFQISGMHSKIDLWDPVLSKTRALLSKYKEQEKSKV